LRKPIEVNEISEAGGWCLPRERLARAAAKFLHGFKFEVRTTERETDGRTRKSVSTGQKKMMPPGKPLLA
jgi:hypothetical protein